MNLSNFKIATKIGGGFEIIVVFLIFIGLTDLSNLKAVTGPSITTPALSNAIHRFSKLNMLGPLSHVKTEYFSMKSILTLLAALFAIRANAECNIPLHLF
jgi:hypothetical protein